MLLGEVYEVEREGGPTWFARVRDVVVVVADVVGVVVVVGVDVVVVGVL